LKEGGVSLTPAFHRPFAADGPDCREEVATGERPWLPLPILFDEASAELFIAAPKKNQARKMVANPQ